MVWPGRNGLTTGELPGADDPGRLHPFTLLLGPVTLLRGWLVPFVIAVFLGRRSEGVLAGLAVVGLGLAGTLAHQFIVFARLRWWVDHEAFHLRTGLFRVENRSIPIDRIHNVDITESPLPRLLGLAEVKVESAASATTDVTLSYVTRRQADAIRGGLAGSRSAAEAGAAEAPVDDVVLVHTGTKELLVAGATANRVGAFAAGTAAVIGWALESGMDAESLVERVVDDLRFDVGLAVTVVVVASLVIGWVASLVEAQIRFHGFTLVLAGDEARRSHGLFTRSSGVTPLRRVQTVRVDRPVLRRVLGYATVVASTAGSVDKESRESGVGVMAPILRSHHVAGLVSTVLRRPVDFETRLEQVSRLAIRRRIIRGSWPIAAVAVPGAWFDPRWPAAAAPAVALVAVWAWRWHAAMGFGAGSDLLVVRSGVLTRKTWYIPTAKVQSAALRAGFFQRRLGLATVIVDTAAAGDGRVLIPDLPHHRAAEVVETLSTVSAESELAALAMRPGLSSDGV